MCGITRFTMMQAANETLGLGEANKINNHSQLVAYMLLREAMLNLPDLWIVLFRHWDNMQETFRIVERIKITFRIDFLKD